MTSKIWGGRFSGGASAVMEEINASVAFDQRLAKQDVRGSRAHCSMLVAQGIISKEDGETIFEEYAARIDFDRVPGNVIVLKDETEGLGAGRIVYRAPVRSPRPRSRRKKRSVTAAG